MTPDPRIALQVAAYRAAWFDGGRPRPEEFMCGDQPVDAAIRAGIDAFRFVAEGLEDLACAARPPARPDGDRGDARFGPFRLLHVVGEGGMGVVWLAEQEEPVRRTVALKMLQPGSARPDLVARFDLERRTLARLDHDHVARMLVAGATNTGEPFFAMEWVDGAPITRDADARRLDVPQRLRLFLGACAGVDHAHQRGVIHRDLKPSNLLVSPQRDGGVAKVIDFGLARVEDADGPLTLAGQVVGTPEYMSPEQIDGSGRIDVRSDVFSLGVILYELLVGSLPTDRVRGERVDPISRQRRILDVDPAAPSARAADSALTPPDVAAQRGTTPRRLQRCLRADLDWIVLKALRRDLAGRYQSVRELAADIERHLRREPVLAGPPSAWYRTRCFARRHAAVLTVTAALLLGAIGLLIGELRRAATQQRYLEVSLPGLLVEARESESALYPPWPERLDAMAGWWAAFYEPVCAALPVLERARHRLEARALPPDPARLAADRREHRDAVFIAQREQQIAVTREELASGTLDDAARASLEADLAAMADAVQSARARLEAWQPLHFADPADAYRHATLVDHLDELRRFVACAPGTASFRVRRAIDHATALRDGLMDRYAASWREAIAAIAASDDVVASAAYGGLRLEPQHDLVPLGMDPDSRLWEFALLRTGSIPARDADSHALVLEDDAAIVFVLLPGGDVQVGASTDPGHPQHDPLGPSCGVYEVWHKHLDPFFLARFEVTRAQWQAMTAGTDPSHYELGHAYEDDPPITLRHPVENLSWESARAVLLEFGLDLPTDVAWEYACRAGGPTRFYTGAGLASLAGHANLREDAGLADGFALAAPVGSFAPNAFGLHDMVGNLREPCRDRFGSHRYANGPGDCLQMDVDAEDQRIFRGGCYESEPAEGLSVVRRSIEPRARVVSLGVRPARRLQRR
ncbi:MAG: SUMF1/EgtB/PvdO family nonheme iron enzyme [Planctomycetes bacterium]|nr:SUMF1/EgtB/PvdO family nonheme iron enzyme [Planctomycetota bacterium]